jgi:hypothetical protein
MMHVDIDDTYTGVVLSDGNVELHEFTGAYYAKVREEIVDGEVKKSYLRNLWYVHQENWHIVLDSETLQPLEFENRDQSDAYIKKHDMKRYPDYHTSDSREGFVAARLAPNNLPDFTYCRLSEDAANDIIQGMRDDDCSFFPNGEELIFQILTSRNALEQTRIWGRILRDPEIKEFFQNRNMRKSNPLLHEIIKSIYYGGSYYNALSKLETFSPSTPSGDGFLNRR